MPNVNINRLDHCAQVGPRGGWCRRKAEIANGWPLDFCAKHNEISRQGIKLFCRKCGTSDTEIEE